MGLVSYLCVAVENVKGYLSYRGPPKRARGPSHTQSCPARVSVPEREILTTSGCENQWDCLSADISKGPKCKLTCQQTHLLWAPALGQQLERCKGHTGKGWRGSFLLDRSAGRGHCSFVEPSHLPARRCKCHHIWVPINLANISDSLRHCPT